MSEKDCKRLWDGQDSKILSILKMSEQDWEKIEGWTRFENPVHLENVRTDWKRLWDGQDSRVLSILKSSNPVQTMEKNQFEN